MDIYTQFQTIKLLYSLSKTSFNQLRGLFALKIYKYYGKLFVVKLLLLLKNIKPSSPIIIHDATEIKEKSVLSVRMEQFYFISSGVREYHFLPLICRFRFLTAVFRQSQTPLQIIKYFLLQSFAQSFSYNLKPNYYSYPTPVEFKR